MEFTESSLKSQVIEADTTLKALETRTLPESMEQAIPTLRGKPILFSFSVEDPSL